MRKGPASVCKNKDFVLFAASQAAATAGDAFQAVAAALLLVEITGSGMDAGIAAAAVPLCGVLASAFAGLLGDRKPEKRLLIAFGLVKLLLMLLFSLARTAWACYALLLLLALANVFYGVPSRKYTAALLPRARLLEGNAALNVLSGAVFFVAPALAGALCETLGTGAALLAGAGFHGVSTLLLAALPPAAARSAARPASPGIAPAAPRERFRGVAARCLENHSLRHAILAFSALSFASSATSLAFYPFAFDVLGVGSTGWGVIVSVYNGAALLSSAFPLLAPGKLGKSYGVPVFICCLMIANAWFSYSLCGSLAAALPLLAVEGAAYSLVATLLTTRLQLLSSPERLARVLGLNDLAVNASRLLGMGAAAAMLPLGPGAVFVSCACLLAAFALTGLLRAAVGKRMDIST